MRLSGNRLRTARLRRVLTQQELAERAGTTESTVNRLENGLQEARISTIRKLAEALEVEPGALMEDGASQEEAAT